MQRRRASTFPKSVGRSATSTSQRFCSARLTLNFEIPIVGIVIMVSCRRNDLPFFFLASSSLACARSRLRFSIFTVSWSMPCQSCHFGMTVMEAKTWRRPVRTIARSWQFVALVIRVLVCWDHHGLSGRAVTQGVAIITMMLRLAPAVCNAVRRQAPNRNILPLS